MEQSPSLLAPGSLSQFLGYEKYFMVRNDFQGNSLDDLVSLFKNLACTIAQRTTPYFIIIQFMESVIAVGLDSVAYFYNNVHIALSYVVTVQDIFPKNPCFWIS